MIVLDASSPALLITQPDHAAVAATIMRHWTAGGLDASPRRAAIMRAIEHHDDGWREVDVHPFLDAATGRVLDFVHIPVAARQSLWPRGVTRLEAEPYAAALVAQHAVHVYRRLRPEPEWSSFFVEMAAARDWHLSAAHETFEHLQDDYVFLRLGDLASLTFCGIDTAGQAGEMGYDLRLDGSRLVVTPDPFAGAEVALQIIARELATTVFGSADEARAAWDSAPLRTLTGVAVGG
jgi:hypothetical protein